jgi:hypothetical protein
VHSFDSISHALLTACHTVLTAISYHFFVMNFLDYVDICKLINACFTSECEFVKRLVHRSINLERMRVPAGRHWI